MAKFIVQIAETRNFEIDVEADDDASAREAAMKVWREAPEVGGYEIADTTEEVVAVSRKSE